MLPATGKRVDFPRGSSARRPADEELTASMDELAAAPDDDGIHQESGTDHSGDDPG